MKRILRRRLYSGSFEWNGRVVQRVQGVHEPIVSLETWERVQRMLDGKYRGKHSRGKHDFAYANLITCANCGSSIVAQKVKERYIYYRCTGYRNRRHDEPLKPCHHKFMREEVLERQFTDMLHQLRIDGKAFEWLCDALLMSQSEQRLGRKEAADGIRAEYELLQRRTEEMYVDKLKGRIDNDFFDGMARKLFERQASCRREIEQLEQTGQCYFEEAVEICKLAKNAHIRLKNQNPCQKRKMLKFFS